MKRYFISFFTLLLVVSMLFGCELPLVNEKETEIATNTTETTQNSEETQTSESKPLTLKINDVNISEYAIVYSKKTITGSEQACKYLKQKLKDTYGVSLTTSTALKDRYEIVISLDAGNQTIATEYKNNPDGYIGVYEKRIFLLAPNYASLVKVIDYFMGKVEGKINQTITITKGEKAEVKKDELKVMSYNVLSDWEKEGRPTDFIAKIGETIMTESPDIFGTQENTTSISNALANEISGYSCYKGGACYESSYLGNYVYWKTDKFKVIKKGFQWMSDTPGARSKYEGSNAYREFTYILFESNETKEQFMFIDVHTDYYGEESVREAQLKVLSAFLKKQCGDSMPYIIVGDFNATSGKASITTFLTDNERVSMTSSVAKERGDVGSSLVVSGFTTRSSYVFDYVFVSSDRIYTKYYSVVVNFTGGKSPSDHLPVVANITLY